MFTINHFQQYITVLETMTRLTHSKIQPKNKSLFKLILYLQTSYRQQLAPAHSLDGNLHQQMETTLQWTSVTGKHIYAISWRNNISSILLESICFFFIIQYISNRPYRMFITGVELQRIDSLVVTIQTNNLTQVPQDNGNIRITYLKCTYTT